MSGLDRVVQLFRIGIVAHLAVGVVLLIEGREVTPEAAATLYGVCVSSALILWAWPVALALWHQPALEALRRQRGGGFVETARWLAPTTALRFEEDKLRGRVEVHIGSLMPPHPVLVGRVVLRSTAPLPAPCRLFVRLARRPGPVPTHARASAPLGEPEFDAHMVFSTGSPEQAQALVAQGICVPLLELYQLSSNLDQFEVSYDGEALVITRSLIVRWQEDWAPWALRVLDRAGRRLLEILHSVEPITEEDVLAASLSFEPARLDAGADTLCLVCAGRLHQGCAAVCQSCETPLHRECWDYNGMCPLFGCGSTLCREQVISECERSEATES